jgi:hypothetical protein
MVTGYTRLKIKSYCAGEGQLLFAVMICHDMNRKDVFIFILPFSGGQAGKACILCIRSTQYPPPPPHLPQFGVFHISYYSQLSTCSSAIPPPLSVSSWALCLKGMMQPLQQGILQWQTSILVLTVLFRQLEEPAVGVKWLPACEDVIPRNKGAFSVGRCYPTLPWHGDCEL